MAKLTASEFREKHARRLKASLQDIANGVDRVTEAPGKKAASRKDKWIARMMDGKVQDRWARNVAAVSLEEWKDKMKNVGINRISTGIDAAATKVEKFAEQLLAYQDSALPQVHNMPNITLEDSKQRMIKWFDLMSQFEYKR